MILQIFTVFDDKTQAYLQPFYMQTKGAAIRAIQDAIDDPQHQFAKHLEDYALFHIGQWDDSNGQFDTSVPAIVGRLIEFKQEA